MGNSGTAARLLCGILASHPLFSVMTGDASLRRRPMRRVIDPLSATGARFAARHRWTDAAGDRGGDGGIAPGTTASPFPRPQVKSAVLLAGLNARGTTRVEEPEATRDHTENMLRHFGATVQVEAAGTGRVIHLRGQPELRAADVTVPGDPSSAAFPLVAALLVPGSSVTIPLGGPEPAPHRPVPDPGRDGRRRRRRQPPRRGRRARGRPDRLRLRPARRRRAGRSARRP